MSVLPQALLKPGITDGGLKASLAKYGQPPGGSADPGFKRVLHFRSMPPGFASFKGFDAKADWDTFEEDLRRIPAMW